MRRIAVVVVVGLCTERAVAEPQPEPVPAPHVVSQPPQASVFVQGGALERADGAAAAGAGVAIASRKRAITGMIGLTRWTGVEGNDERTWELELRSYFHLPRYWRLQSHFFLGAGLDRTTSSSVSGTGGMYEIGFGGSLQITSWLSAWCDASLGRRFWLDAERSSEMAMRTDDASFTKAMFGLAASYTY